MQSTNNILMVRPHRFVANALTAATNAFQHLSLTGDLSSDEVARRARQEFDQMVALLRQHGVNVIEVEDTHEPHTPDAIFPNNWVSFHLDGTVCLYPMLAPNRRHERRPDILDALRDQHGFEIRRKFDFSAYEREDRFLEGTGSKVLDRENRIAYACISPRTDRGILEEFCAQMRYQPVVFNAEANGMAVYHTNVLMNIGNSFAVVCLEALPDETSREALRDTLLDTRKEVIEITLSQLNAFAGNMLQVLGRDNQLLLVMSARAHRSLRPDQITRLESYATLVSTPLDTIEAQSGGGARCMMAEVFLPMA